ncbi:MAG: ABC transporter substrate-binding protein [Dehalococcoidia bacterium]
MQPRGIFRRPIVFGAAFAIAVAAAVAALALRADEGATGLLGPTEYVEGVAGSPQRVNPIFSSQNAVDEDLVQLVFSGLVGLGPSGEVRPDLADLPAISDGGRTYTFTLNPDARWHDGQRVTSRDVAFTIEKVTEPGFRGDSQLAAAWLEVEVETPDDETVVLRLPQASAPFLARAATLGILPSHLLEGVSAEEMEQASFNSRPVGSGPYRLESMDSREAHLVAHGDYHLGAPLIGTIRIRFYTDYPSAIRAAAAGQLDGLMVRDGLSEAQLAEVTKLKDRTVGQPQRSAFIVLYLNNDQALFSDPRVRQAISLALDRQEIVDNAFLGLATASKSPIAPGSWAYSQQYDLQEANLAKARELLTEAGWQASPTTGILVREGGEFRFTIRVDSDEGRLRAAEQVARQLETLGIRATVASTTFSVLRRDFLQERKYDAAVAGWDQGADPDPYFGWHSSQMGTAGLNLANFADIVADSLIAQGRTSQDFEVRKDAYRQFQEVWAELEPSVVLAYPRYIYVYPESMEGVPEGAIFAAPLRFADVHRWRR